MLMCSIGVLTSCTQVDPPPRPTSAKLFGYAVNSTLLTTNVGSAVGAAGHAQVLSGRLWPSTYVVGPRGQLIPNTDLAEAQFLPGVQQRVIYRIKPEAVYSDGQPITCDAFLLAYTAGVQTDIFDSHLPLMEQIDKLECSPGSKQATVIFKPGFGARWRQLFGPGVLLPAHAIAAKAGLSLEELNTQLHSKDSDVLAPVSEIWNDGFNLQNFDPELQVSSGPFVIEQVGEHGEVYLQRNEHYYGAAALLPSLVVWPRDADLKALQADDSLHVVDVGGTSDLSWLNRDDPENPFEVELANSILTEQLVLATAGTFYDAEQRKQFAACIDQERLAAISSEHAGVTVQPSFVRTLRMNDPARERMADIVEPHRHVQIEEAKKLEGTQIRIGYQQPSPRKAAMVEAIRQSCQAAGIEVIDASAEGQTFSDLSQTHVSEWGYEEYTEGALDAVLVTIDPAQEFPSIAGTSVDAEAARNAERASWDEVRTIPIAAEPRVFVYDRSVGNIVGNTDLSGIGWNMDRWRLE